MAIPAGEVHAVLGENGSGKSTLIKIISGYHQPEPGGQVLIGGRKLRWGLPGAAYALGARFVHQDLGLVDSASIADNLSFGAGFPTRLGTIRPRELRREASQDLAAVGLDLDPVLAVGALPAAFKTGVAVARALRVDPCSPVTLLVMDEPTATLPDSEVRQILAIVRAAAAGGVAVLYVTHRIDEVFDIADKVTVLRDGRKVATTPAASLSRGGLLRMLTGTELAHVRAATADLPAEVADRRNRPPVLEVAGLSAGPLTAVDLRVGSGEIVGVAGITGSGRESLLAAIFGATSCDRGTVKIEGRELPRIRPDLMIAAGLAYVPVDRKSHGAILSLRARENLTLCDLRPFWKSPALRRRAEIAETAAWFERLGVRPRDGFEQPLATFSGGNQQKIVLAKWLRRQPRVLLLDEPTHGIDVGARAELHRQILAAAARGAAVVISSTDADELEAICHRVVVVRAGRLVADLSGHEVTAHRITQCTLGAEVTAA
jgi:ribose transport system ATP-binding protein